MESLFFLFSALWLGILTSISPCPLATNIAAVSFVGRRLGSPLYVLTCGLFYTLGRTVLYTALGLALSFAMHAIPSVSDFLQTKMTYILAPLMILVGVILLGILPIKMPKLSLGFKAEEKLAKLGLFGAFSIGFLFASALCPVSAALFFSNLINTNGNFLALVLYGIGTGLPVLAFSFVLAFSASKISRVYKATATFEKGARILTAIIFIGVGIYSLWRVL